MKWGKLPRSGVSEKFKKDDWSSFYRQRPYKPVKHRSGRSGMFRITAVLVILVALVVARQFPHPMGDQVREDLRYLLTAEWNFQPLVDKSVQLAAQLVNWDNPVIYGPPGIDSPTEPVASPALTDEKMSVPVSGKIIREFGWSQSTVDDLQRYNHGIDISAEPGAKVAAALDGRVVRVDLDGQLGQYIVVDHGGGTYTLYGGVADVSVVEGEDVTAGQQIAVVGDSDVTGGGLHFELRESGELVDPMVRLQTDR